MVEYERVARPDEVALVALRQEEIYEKASEKEDRRSKEEYGDFQKIPPALYLSQ